MRNPKAVARVRKELGRNIWQKRKALGLTQAETAERAGLHPRHYQKIEAGESNVSLSSIVGIAYALETTVAALFAERRAGT